MFEIEGAQTTAVVHGEQDAFDEAFVEQVQEITDHEAFEDGRIRIMPDGHAGAGAVIGLTMPMTERVCPNTIGVDIGCGMRAVRLDDLGEYDPDDPEELSELDEQIREEIPMGYSVHDRNEYHMRDDFPWDVCAEKLATFNEHSSFDEIEADYGIEYFKDVCQRVGYDVTRAINSLGTLGGGNHFVELARSELTGDVWCVIHSGSRGIGAAIAQYWQNRATEERQRAFILEHVPDEHWQYVVPDRDDPELVAWFQGGTGQSYIDSEAIREDCEDNYRIGEIHDEIREGHPDNRDGDTDLDYLEGESIAGYIRDMVFAQTYAHESRRQMTAAVADVVGVEPSSHIDSVHNYIHFRDQIIRKGACRAQSGQRAIIPFNMAEGSLIVRGLGKDEWNRSCPHGAGRQMSRTEAFDTVTLADFEASMDGIVSTSVTEDTIDEAPAAYKDTESVEESLTDAASITDRLTPLLNVKALD